ncbi:MAG: methyltransferase domain-containing protein [Deltaproteobacteria bacterium]|nr:methyltransferase domain-containing protein [Deltaproteobacteria bacterium]
MTPQVDRETYVSAGYADARRFASYGHQLTETAALAPESVLEIGIGNGWLTQLLRQRVPRVTTLDFDGHLAPQVVGSVAALPVRSTGFDAVLCCQVLEHLPFDAFGAALSELRRVARRFAVVTLPDCNRYLQASLRLPGTRERRLHLELPNWNPTLLTFRGEHYWEIGARGYPLSRIIGTMAAAGFAVTKTYRLWENPYHRMFVLHRGDLLP